MNSQNFSRCVSVIVASYNTRTMTLDCLRTLEAGLAGLDAEVLVVDNASHDGSAAAIREAFPHVRLIENDRNVGFGAANNRAMREACGEFLLLLNSDAFPEPGAVSALVACLRRRPEVGVVGPRLLNADGSLQKSCYRFPSPSLAWRENLWVSAVFASHPRLGDYRRWPHDRERVVEWVIGACLLVRREAYVQVGGFDEQFFMYSEETDWQRRLHRQGWAVAFLPSARVTHLAGGSGQREKSMVDRHFFDSYDRYVRKHHGPIGLLSMRLAMIVGCALRAALWSVIALVPRRRAAAAAKARFQARLVVRQATHWPRTRVASGSG